MDSMTLFGRAKCKRNGPGKVCTCQEWVPLEKDESLCECCGDHMSFHEPLDHPIASGYGRCVRECDDARPSREDGCQEFFPLYASSSSKCAGCGCHRSYHEKVTVAVGELAGPSNVHLQQQDFLSDDRPSTSLLQSSSKKLKLDHLIIPMEADAGHDGFRPDLKNESDMVVLEPKHKVFLSHSGAQKDFVEQLCIDLETCDRYPFFDKRKSSLPVGMKFPERLFAAIQQSEVGVVVLSEEFFSRTKWPMLELVEMVRSLASRSMIIVPVFLSITREECRKLESQERWIPRWKEWAKKDKTIDIEEWKLALKIFGLTISLSYKDGEVSLRKEVVDAVCELVLPESRWDDSNVEGKDRLCKVILDKVGLEVKDPKVRVMGLYGIGGIGKTTICKVLCNKLFKEFRGRVCHTELKRESQLELFQEVLKVLTDTRHDNLERMNIDKCKDQLKRCIVKQPIFLAIDNVDEDSAEQAKAYLRAKHSFGNGSVVVVTSRSLSQLLALNVHEDDCLGMPELELREARDLFRNYAKSIGDVEYELDERIVSCCLQMCRFNKGDGESFHYHPLALTVLGNEVREQMACNNFDPALWYSRFSRIEESYKVLETKKQIFSILRISYDTLLPNDKMLFMDVALFMRNSGSWDSESFDSVGANLYERLEIVHGLRNHDELKTRLEKLKKKSLLEKVCDGSTDVVMHDLWREFCVAETKVGKSAERKWVYFEECYDELEESTPSGSCWENLGRMYVMSKAGVQKFLKLRLDHFSNVKLLTVRDALIASDPMVVDMGKMIHLKYLEIRHNWQYIERVKVYGLQSLTNLAFLQWVNMPEEVGYAEGIGRLTNLQFLKLPDCRGNTLPDMSSLTSLRMASFPRSREVDTIRGLTGKLSKLKYLNLADCEKLRSCPGVGDLLGLKALDISGCWQLEQLPNLGKLTNLTDLNMYGCSFLRVCPGLWGLRNLLRLDISFCPLSILASLSGLVSLEEFSACHCSNLATFPGMCKLSALKKLDLSGCQSLVALPDLYYFPQLKTFDLHDCERLTALNSLVPLLALEKLDLTRCTSLTTLPDLGNFPNLKELNLRRCKSLTGITSDKPLAALKKVNLRRCVNVKALPDLANFPQLKFLDLCHCESLTSFCCSVPSLALENLYPNGCIRLKLLPDLGYFPGLKSLRLRDCQSLIKITSEGALPALQFLELWRCIGLVALPDLGYFPDLRYLCLRDCKRLTSVNIGVPLLALHTLDLGGCVRLEQLADLSNFPSLKWIDLEMCKSLLRLTSSEPLLALRSLNAKRCRSLEALPDHLCSSVELKYLGVWGSGIELSEDTVNELLASCVQLQSVDTTPVRIILGEDRDWDDRSESDYDPADDWLSDTTLDPSDSSDSADEDVSSTD